MIKYIVKVNYKTSANRSKEIEYSGRRHADEGAAHRELEQALKNDKNVLAAWLEEVNV